MKSKYILGAIILSVILVIIFSLGFGNFDSVDEIDESKKFFDDSYVHELRLYFDNDDWYSQLYENHQSEDDPYSSASLYHEDYEFYSVGVRFKGSSSFSYQSNKKSFKIDVNEFFEQCNIYDDLPECEDLSFYGLRKINLNNGFKDPSFMREKLFLDIASNYLPTIRTIFVNVYVNDKYMGLYTGVEQPDDTFIEMNYGGVGNLFECEKTTSEGKSGTFGSDLGYLGDDVEEYYGYYELKTTEEKDSWEGLLHFIDVLNNYNDEDFVDEIESIANVDQFLAMIAMNNLFGNYDSYSGSAHNYYVYEDNEGIFHPIFWDTNEAFGSFDRGAPNDQSNADIFFGNYILEERFFAIEKYKERYMEIVEDIAVNYLDPEKMEIMISDYAELIRDDVYSDPLKIYSNEDFENALYSQNGEVDEGDVIEETVVIKRRNYVVSKNMGSSNLMDFVSERYSSVINQLENN